MEESLLKGQGLADMLSGLGFSDAILTQISLADRHGNIETTLVAIQHYLNQMARIRRKTVEVITYPLILLLFFCDDARVETLFSPSIGNSKSDNLLS